MLASCHSCHVCKLTGRWLAGTCRSLTVPRSKLSWRSEQALVGQSRFILRSATQAATMADETQMHTFPKGTFRLENRFSPIEVIGSGAYGMVCSATDNVSRKKVAIKKIASAFTMVQVAKRTLREIKLLKHFHSHKNIISILTVQKPPTTAAEFKDLYVVMELQECDLHRIIHSQQALSEEHTRYFLYQLLCGLKFIHSANVLHRDLKPGNLLINGDCSLRIADFGMARHMATSPEDHSNFMTEYVATRWYRAPEVLLSFASYTQAIDVWSVGCILAEMLGRRYLFPGRDYLHQLSLILSLLGTPKETVVQQVGSQLARKALENFAGIPALNLVEVFPDASPEVLTLLAGMITFDPAQRMTVADALQSPFLARYRQPTQEPVCAPFSFDFEVGVLYCLQGLEVTAVLLTDLASRISLWIYMLYSSWCMTRPWSTILLAQR